MTAASKALRSLLVAITIAALGLATVIVDAPPASAAVKQDTSNPVVNRSVAISGGGFRSHSGQAAWTMAMLNKSGMTLDQAMQNVGPISSNSGGSWFLTQLAYSKATDPFQEALSAPNPVDNWTGSTGYLGKIEQMYNAHSWSCPSGFESICGGGVNTGLGYIAAAILLGQAAGDSKLSWREAVQNLVFEPYGMNSGANSLTAKNLTSQRTGWSQGKPLVIGTSVLTDQVVLNQRPLSSYLDKGFYSAAVEAPGGEPSVNQAPATPVSLLSPSSAPGSATSGFLAGMPTFGYGNDVSDPNDKTSTPARSAYLDATNLPVIDAAAMSSAAVGAGASVSVLKQANLPWYYPITNAEAAYLLSGMAPAYNLNTMDFVDSDQIPSSWGSDEFASNHLARFADGGYGDNSSAVHNLRYLQDNGQADNFDLVVFDNTATPNVTGDEHYRNMSGDIANLFGYQETDGHVPDCQSGFCTNVVSPHVFQQVTPSAESTWKYPQSSSSASEPALSYNSYQVTTVANDSFGIQAGHHGTVHVFQAIGDVPAAPLSPADFPAYKAYMNTIYDGVTTGGGWPYLKAAMGIADKEAPAPKPPPSTPLSPHKTKLRVAIAKKGKRLPVGKRIKVVRSAKSTGRLNVKVTCQVRGETVTGKGKRRICKVQSRKNRATKNRATKSTAKVWVTPKCSAGLKIKVRITAKRPHFLKARWQHTWKVKRRPRQSCSR